MLLAIAFIALGVLTRGIEPTGNYRDDAGLLVWLTYAFSGVSMVVPSIAAIAFVWMAFVRPGWSDRLLWSTALILTVALAASVARLAFANRTSLHGIGMYPNAAAAVGAIAYGTWLMIADRSSWAPWRRVLTATLCLSALAAIAAYPLVSKTVRFVDFAGSFIFAAAFFTLGGFIANRAGVDIMAREVEE